MKNIFLLWHSPFSKTIIFTDSVHDYEILEKSLEKLSSKVTGKLLWNTNENTYVSQPIVVSLSLNIQIQKSLLVNDKSYENLFILRPKLNDFSLSFLENLRLLLVGWKSILRTEKVLKVISFFCFCCFSLRGSFKPCLFIWQICFKPILKHAKISQNICSTRNSDFTAKIQIWF